MNEEKPNNDNELYYTMMSTRDQGKWVLTATIIGSSMVFIDGTVVNLALPVLQTEFKATITDAQWVVESYALLLSALMLVGGSLGDLLGRRRIFAIGVTLFAAASFCCGISRTILELILTRAVQGIGGALLTPGSLAIISAFFPKNERGRAIGTWSGFSAMVTGLGPILGGWLIAHASWRVAFWINIPLAVVVLVILFRSVPESRDEKVRGNLDWPGALLATFGFGSIVYGLIESSNRVGSGSHWLGAILAGVVLLAAFVFVECSRQNPMVDLTFFRSRNFTGANLLTLFLYAALSGLLFFLPFNLIQVRHYTTTMAGAVFLPFVVIMFSLSRWAGGLVSHYGAKRPLVIGPIIAAIGYIIVAQSDLSATYWTTFFPAIVMLGLGMTVTVAPLTTTVMSTVNESYAGIASGINNAVSRLSGLLAVAILGIVLVQSFKAELNQRLLVLPSQIKTAIRADSTALAAMQLPANLSAPTKLAVRSAINESFLSAFRLVGLISAALALASALIALLLIT